MAESISTSLMSTACPHDPGDTADLYVMGHLSGTQVVSYERHLQQCAKCRQEVEFSKVFRRALADALQEDDPT
jgi:hypothetical protein